MSVRYGGRTFTGDDAVAAADKGQADKLAALLAAGMEPDVQDKQVKFNSGPQTQYYRPVFRETAVWPWAG
jgi:hypothetical protein